MLNDRPKILVFAGPNGSGKSTITDGYPIIGVYVNTDDIKRHRGCSDIEAAKEAEALRESLINGRKSFTFETVLSTERNIRLLEKAKSFGYYIESIYVLTADVELNVGRVQARVAKGGHDVPKDKIRSRYIKSLQLMKTLIAISDECIVADNTVCPEIIFKKDADCEIYLPNDFWDEDKLRKLLATSP
ncbi:MAG: zeta toxin family protein [Oscillospiraceae bacterium]|nr:zeta toxin family protein [Oscillospiraceae bacterium]